MITAMRSILLCSYVSYLCLFFSLSLSRFEQMFLGGKQFTFFPFPIIATLISGWGLCLLIYLSFLPPSLLLCNLHFSLWFNDFMFYASCGFSSIFCLHDSNNCTGEDVTFLCFRFEGKQQFYFTASTVYRWLATGSFFFGREGNHFNTSLPFCSHHVCLVPPTLVEKGSYDWGEAATQLFCFDSFII